MCWGYIPFHSVRVSTTALFTPFFDIAIFPVDIFRDLEVAHISCQGKILAYGRVQTTVLKQRVIMKSVADS